MIYAYLLTVSPVMTVVKTRLVAEMLKTFAGDGCNCSELETCRLRDAACTLEIALREKEKLIIKSLLSSFSLNE